MASRRRERHGGNDADAESDARCRTTRTRGPDRLRPAGRQRQTTRGSTTSSSESGQGGSGVGVAAAIAINVLIVTTLSSSIGPDGRYRHERRRDRPRDELRPTDREGDGHAQEGRRGANIAAAVGFNYAHVDNLATVARDATLTGLGITVEAVTPPAATTNDFIRVGLRRFGRHGSDVERSPARSRSTLLTFTSEATVGAGATLDLEPGRRSPCARLDAGHAPEPRARRAPGDTAPPSARPSRSTSSRRPRRRRGANASSTPPARSS